MKKEVLQVPAGIRYISDWKEYSLDKYQFPHIINKQLTGCGFTEYCIKNEENVVLCSPRKILLENKEKQHSGEVFYIRNEIGQEIGYDEDISVPKKESNKNNDTLEEERKKEEERQKKEDERIKKEVISLKQQIKNYVNRCITEHKPCKILVTYDSFRHVKETLKDIGILDSFYVVIDEFQSLLTDSKFKSSTEVEFINQLTEGLTKVCFVSATPMMDKYLEMLDEFKDLPYYEFDWETLDPSRVNTPRLVVKSVKSIIKEVTRVIEEYRAGKFKTYAYKDQNGKIIESVSKEAVIYVNSVKNICEIITKCGLSQEETNILCARTHKNEEKIRKAFNVSKQDFLGVGNVPTKGQPHKMFTLCTRTVYLGADFYSTCARCFIFSDANIKSLSVDITLDLPQILGRQRLEENPWRNSAELYFKTTNDINKRTKEDFNNEMEAKLKDTNHLLSIYERLEDPEEKRSYLMCLEDNSKMLNYRKNYIAVDHHAGKEPKPVINRMVMIAEMRSFEIQQVDYKDRFSVFSSIAKENLTIEEELKPNKEKSQINEAFTIFNNLTNFQDRMRFICTYKTDKVTFPKSIIEELLTMIPEEYEKYYYVLGPELILGYSCQRSKVEQEYLKIVQGQGLENVIRTDIYNRFVVGNKYICADVKKIIGDVYSIHSFKKTAKAIDIENYFETKRCNLEDSTGKMCRGIKLEKKKF